MRNLRSHLLPTLIWTLAFLAVYGPVVLGARSLPYSDLTIQFYPYAAFQHDEFLAGRLPIWSPGSYGGNPLAADIQSGVFNPCGI